MSRQRSVRDLWAARSHAGEGDRAANPFAGVIVSVKLVDSPAATVALCGVAFSE
jgi:hypothetical protein